MKIGRVEAFLLFLFLFGSLVWGIFFIHDKPLYSDEYVHYAQIEDFLRGHFRLQPALTTLPGYHSVLAIFALAFDFFSPSLIRSISFSFALLTILLFFLLVHEIRKESVLIKGFYYGFFPLLFPFFFLIYTDVFSLLFLLLSFYLLLQRHSWIASIFGVLSLGIRQNNIIWLGFFCAFLYYERFGFSVNVRSLKSFFKDSFVFLLGFALFLVFLFINKGIAVGDRAMHPPFSLHFENVFFMLFLFFFLFLPLHVFHFRKIVQFVRRKPLVLLLLLGIFLYYLKFFIVDHPYNLLGERYFLRNWLLSYFSVGMGLKALLFLPIAYSLLSLFMIRLERPPFYLLYFFSVLSLLPSWLIEQRYYLVPFVFFILFKEEDSQWVRYATLVLYIVLSLLFLYFIGIGKYFI